MKTNSKSLKVVITTIALVFVVLLSSLILTACGGGEEDTHSTYTFETDIPEEITVGETHNYNMTLKADEVREEGYAHVLIQIELSDTENVDIFATDSLQQEYNLAEIGYWGPPTGFEITPDYSATTPIRVVIREAGSYTVTLKLIDLDNDNAVITEQTNTYTAVV